jgi:hypothetical protein
MRPGNNEEGYQISSVRPSNATGLEPKLRATRVELEALVDGDVIGYGSGGTCSGAAVEATVAHIDVILDEALSSDAAVNAVAEEQIGASTEVTGDCAGAGGLQELSLERSGILR